MKLSNPKHQALYEYWKSLARDSHLPKKRDIDPTDMPKSILSNVSLLTVESEPHRRYRIKHAGTSYYDNFHTEISGKYLDEIDLGSDKEYWTQRHDQCVRDGKPKCGVRQVKTTGRNHVVQYWLKLPLSDDGKTVTSILSCDLFHGEFSGQEM